MNNVIFAVSDQGRPILLATVGDTERESLQKMAYERGSRQDLNGMDIESLRKMCGDPEVKEYRLVEAKRGK